MSVELSLIFPLLCLLENSRLNFIAMYNVLQNKWEENITTQIYFQMRSVGYRNGFFYSLHFSNNRFSFDFK